MILKKITSRVNLFLALVSFAFIALAPATVAASSINVWWPTNNAHVQATQPFKAMIQGVDVSQYEMYWQVDNGQWNHMDNNYTDYQHKEASVDLTSWKWHGSGPYVINFIAQQNGQVIAQQAETIYVDNGLPTQGTAAPSATVALVTKTTPAPVPTTTTVTTTVVLPVSAAVAANPMKLFVDPNSNAAKQAAAWATSNAVGAAAMKVLAAQPTAVWLGDWNSNIQNDAHTLVTAAAAQGTTPVMVVYNIPERDCGGFSAGGSNNPAGYTAWIQSLATGIGSSRATIILEPDALAQISCLSAQDQQTRLSLITSAVNTLKNNPNAKVYIDAGHSGWIDPTTMSVRLSQSNIAKADGFALNVSNFMPSSSEVAYGQQISSQINNKHFVVDTSRNGNGSNGQWCNPPGMAIGVTPTTQTGNTLADAFLWLKTPGESDGNCNGGPNAGVWWPDYALQLVQNAHQ